MWSTINTVIAAITIFVGVYMLNYGDPKLASISGVLIGGSFAFISGAINNFFSERQKNKDKKNKAEAIRKIVIADLIPIVLDHISIRNEFLTWERTLETSASSGNFFPKDLEMIEPLFFSRLGSDLTLLDLNEIDALVNFYANFERTRRYIERLKTTPNQILNYFTAKKIRELFDNDLEVLSKVIERFCPSRRFRLSDGRLIELLSIIKNPDQIKM